MYIVYLNGASIYINNNIYQVSMPSFDYNVIQSVFSVIFVNVCNNFAFIHLFRVKFFRLKFTVPLSICLLI